MVYRLYALAAGLPPEYNVVRVLDILYTAGQNLSHFPHCGQPLTSSLCDPYNYTHHRKQKQHTQAHRRLTLFNEVSLTAANSATEVFRGHSECWASSLCMELAIDKWSVQYVLHTVASAEPQPMFISVTGK